MSQWNCCHRVAETRPDGSMTTWVYDDENRLTEMSRLTSLDSTNVTWITTKYAYDGLGREITSQVTNLVAGVGLPSTQRTYDGLGRLATETNEAGRVTTWVYSAGGLTTTTTYPNGATRVQSRAADGSSSSVTGTASVPEWTTTTAQLSGARSTVTRVGRRDSARVSTRVENMLGEVVRETQAGVGGATLATTNTYDAAGRLVRVERTGSPVVEYEYDTLGERVATVTRVASGEWRKSESYSGYALRGSDIWAVQTNVVSCSDATIAPQIHWP